MVMGAGWQPGARMQRGLMGWGTVSSMWGARQDALPAVTRCSGLLSASFCTVLHVDGWAAPLRARPRSPTPTQALATTLLSSEISFLASLGVRTPGCR